MTMKKTIFLFIILIPHISCFSQEWSAAQLEKANTAADVAGLSADEQTAIMYINLARLFPKDFVEIELADDADLNRESPANTNSLIATLNQGNTAPALYFDMALYESARCFAKESGDKGTVGHKRKSCTKNYEGECCSYGEKAGWDIALQWLIDDNQAGLGHRKICLSTTYTKIGLSVHTHKKYGVCAVADFGQ